MCGLIGALWRRSQPEGARESIARGLRRMVSRGPDGEGTWSEENLVVAHRRLAILDLDSRADQPLVLDDGRLVIVFNGEIYNFRELRASLKQEGVLFRTESDTETILRLFSREGEAMLPKLRGMFAFAIWDRQTRSLFLARDPYGIKPLYLARAAEGWLFGSQVKALLATGLVSREPDPQGQAGFWLMGSVPEPRTWYRDVTSLPAGSWCRLTEEGGFSAAVRYWDIGDTWRGAPECRLAAGEIQESVRETLSESVKQHRVADVPIAIFLSGGIDSGSVAGLMNEAGAKDLQGITLAFKEFEGTPEDETSAAAEVARFYGIRHHVRLVDRREFEEDLPRILAAMDQPSVDGINTWYASKAVAELGFKVVLSGVGGDELFCGYDTFREIPRLMSRWKRLKRIPGARPLAGIALAFKARRSGNSRWRWLERLAGSLYGAYWLKRGLFSPDELPGLMGGDAAREAWNAPEPEALVQEMAGVLPADPGAAVGQMESMAYLRNQLLRDSDWASMDHGVELRTPLVDAWLLRDLGPVLRGLDTVPPKVFLSRAPRIPLPQAVLARPKTGFSIPAGRWLRERSPGARGESGSRGWARQLAATYSEDSR